MRRQLAWLGFRHRFWRNLLPGVVLWTVTIALLVGVLHLTMVTTLLLCLLAVLIQGFALYLQDGAASSGMRSGDGRRGPGRRPGDGGELRHMPSRTDHYDPLLSVVDCLRLVHAAGEVEAVLQAITETACTATGSTRGLAGLCDGSRVTSTGWYDIDDGWTACNLGWGLGEGGPGRVCQSGKPLVCNELPPTAGGLAEATEVLALTSFASVPIVDESGTPLGFLEVGNAPESYSPNDVRCLTSLGAHAALRLHAIIGQERRDLLEREKREEREELAVELERLLAPAVPPLVAGVEIGAPVAGRAAATASAATSSTTSTSPKLSWGSASAMCPARASRRWPGWWSPSTRCVPSSRRSAGPCGRVRRCARCRTLCATSSARTAS